jgi:hypothetical protein
MPHSQRITSRTHTDALRAGKVSGEATMPLIELIIVIALVGVVMWAINTYIPMSAGMKKLLNIAVVVVVVLWLLKLFGIFDSLSTVTV